VLFAPPPDATNLAAEAALRDRAAAGAGRRDGAAFDVAKLAARVGEISGLLRSRLPKHYIWTISGQHVKQISEQHAVPHPPFECLGPSADFFVAKTSRVAFLVGNRVQRAERGFSKLNRSAHRYPYLRFSQHLARLTARLAAKMDSDFLPGRTLHSQQHAVYPAHFRYPTYQFGTMPHIKWAKGWVIIPPH